MQTMPRTDRVSRIVDAPVHRVLDALVQQEASETWLPPGDMTGRFERSDPSPGGSYRLLLTYAPADAPHKPRTQPIRTSWMSGTWTSSPDDRVVQALDFVADAPEYTSTMTMTWVVSEEAGGTRVEIVAADVPDGISAEDHAAGLGSSLDNLARFVQR